MKINSLFLTFIITFFCLESIFLVYAQSYTDLDSIVNNVISNTDEQERLRQEELAHQRALEEARKQKELEAQQEADRLRAEEAQRLINLQQTASGSYEITIDESIRIEFKWYRARIMARYVTLRQCIIPSEDAERSMRIVCPRIGEYQIKIDTMIGDYASRISGQDKTNQLIMLNARKEEINDLAPSFLSSIVVNEQSDGQLFIEYTQYMLDMYIWIADHRTSSLLPSLNHSS